MDLRKHGTILLNGFVVVAPILITFYVVGAAVWWLDRTVRLGLSRLGWQDPIPGLGVLVGLAAIYAVGLLARTWLFGWLISLGERIVDRIPLVKSLYSAVRDLLQFLGGTKEESRGKPAVVKSEDGKVLMLGLITQEKPGKFLPDDAERVAVYLPMSYQLGGYTLFVPPEAVQEIEGLSVEDLMKLTLTAGVGGAKPVGRPNERAELPAESESEVPDSGA
ncbi:MAG: DUF502 domain-containing protein [Planctomycetota bacterium]|jgi:uncharacterized membrane protein